MDCDLLCNFWLLICSTTWFLLMNQISGHSLFHVHHKPRIPTNVTKNLYFPNFNPNINNIHEIKLLGSASISQGLGFIQIPDPSPTLVHANQAGRAIYSSPIRLFDPLTLTPASFQTTFSFQFTTDNSFPGNGLAFVIEPDEFTPGRPGPWLGILNDACDHYKVFAVEFDNSHDPEFGDPNDDHVGVDLGGVVSFKTANVSSQINASLHDDSIHRAWIRYDGHKKWIDIYLGVDGSPLPSQPILSAPLNLSPFLNEYMFVGFSASTGDSPQIHTILSWNFSSTIQASLNVPLKHVCHRNVAHQVSKYSINHTYSTTRSSFMIFMCVVALCTITFLNFYCYNSNRKSETESLLAFSFPGQKQRPNPPSKPRRFVILEIYKATKRFNKMEVLSSDSRGVLYRGSLPNGRYVAVKRFSTEFHNMSSLNWTRVLRRISSVTQVCHPGLAPIRGWCCDNRETILVYDYYQNGSLDRWLFGLGALPWTRRVKLIKDIGEALSFLHSKEVTHGNLNSSSVFLDSNYNGVLGDYGFIFLQGKSREKAVDVLWFGMLVLEIVAGKKRVETENGEEMGVLEYAWSMHEKEEMLKVVDEKVGRNVNSEEAIRVLEIGLSCSMISEINNGSPSMADVVHLFNMSNPGPILPPSRPASACPETLI